MIEADQRIHLLILGGRAVAFSISAPADHRNRPRRWRQTIHEQPVYSAGLVPNDLRSDGPHDSSRLALPSSTTSRSL